MGSSAEHHAVPGKPISAELPSQRAIVREMRIDYGPVPHSLTEEVLRESHSQMVDGNFLLRAEGEHYFHYRPGHGVTIERGAGANLAEESLWLDGSVYAAVASLIGLLPIHASAVAHNGRVFAFTGAAGSGKSTLAAALGANALPMFCDDTLVLDLSDPGRIVCLPGHKRLKLCADAFPLTKAAREEDVSSAYPKSYARPLASWTGGALPLAELIFLEEGPDPALTPIVGAQKIVRLDDHHQTARLFAQATQWERSTIFAHRARLARQVAMAVFARPIDRSRFAESVALIASHIYERQP